MTAAFVKKAAEDPTAPTWIRYVAMLTGALAAVAGYLTVRSTVLSNQAIYNSNQGVLYQAQASDAWAEYQADSVKARMSEIAMKTTKDPDAIQWLTVQDVVTRDRQPQAKKDAQDLELERNDVLAHSKRLLGERDILQYAGMAVQLGIALASVAALTRRYDAFMAGVICGVLGVLTTGYALAAHFLIKG